MLAITAAFGKRLLLGPRWRAGELSSEEELIHVGSSAHHIDRSSRAAGAPTPRREKEMHLFYSDRTKSLNLALRYSRLADLPGRRVAKKAGGRSAR